VVVNPTQNKTKLYTKKNIYRNKRILTGING
jgi:hypothetical protein